MTYTRQARWEIQYEAVLVDHVFGRDQHPREEAKRIFEAARRKAKIDGGAAKLLRNGVVKDRFSYTAWNE